MRVYHLGERRFVSVTASVIDLVAEIELGRVLVVQPTRAVLDYGLVPLSGGEVLDVRDSLRRLDLLVAPPRVAVRLPGGLIVARALVMNSQPIRIYDDPALGMGLDAEA
jgi:hypothetical protein